MAKQCIHGFVSGKVQGVFFRASAQTQAKALGITGWVQNTQDGRVEVMACGDAQSLDEFKAWLQQGPRGSEVHSLDLNACAPASFDEFSIKYE